MGQETTKGGWAILPTRSALMGFAVAMIGVVSAAQAQEQGLPQAPASETAPPVMVVKPDPASADPVVRGAYVFQAAGCLGCHTDEKGGGDRLAGGRALVTPFGTFRTPNITPDPVHGIGGWSEDAFIAAFRSGRDPEGTPLYPAFPYASYTRMTDGDLKDLRAYLLTQAASPTVDQPHELSFPFSIRTGLVFWQWLNMPLSGPAEPVAGKSEVWHRGRYLVDALGHCAECHSPRNFLGGLDGDRYLAGNPDGVDGDRIPNITPHEKSGVGKWSPGDLSLFFRTGMMPDGDVAGGGMAEVVRNSTSRLTDADLDAMIAYLRDIPALE